MGVERSTISEPSPMTILTPLGDLELIPVLELEPFLFATREQARPTGTARDMPEDSHRYWLDSLADSGLIDLTPLRPGSWHVPTRNLTIPEVLRRILDVIVSHWGGMDCLEDPESRQALGGGLALLSEGEVLVEPKCCSDLSNLSNWRDAAGYRGHDWTMLWIGHPWLSYRFDGKRLILGGPHELLEPADRWSVRPEELGRAVVTAEEELVGFASRLECLLTDLGAGQSAGDIARNLAGLTL
jgi:hypothetical protein